MPANVIRTQVQGFSTRSSGKFLGLIANYHFINYYTTESKVFLAHNVVFRLSLR